MPRRIGAFEPDGEVEGRVDDVPDSLTTGVRGSPILNAFLDSCAENPTDPVDWRLSMARDFFSESSSIVELLESWEEVRKRELEKSGLSLLADAFFGRRRRRDQRFRFGEEGADAENPEFREFDFSKGR